jgi:hypothetical protein
MIGLKRSYFQPHATLAHYDLTPSKRAAAIRLGAKEITTAERLQKEREKYKHALDESNRDRQVTKITQD